MNSIVQSFLAGGSFVATINYIGNHVDPIFAGLLSGLPIPIITTYYIKDSKAKNYVLNLVYTGLAATIVTIIYGILFVWTNNVTKNQGIIIAISLWFLFITLMYYYQKYMI